MQLLFVQVVRVWLHLELQLYDGPLLLPPLPPPLPPLPLPLQHWRLLTASLGLQVTVFLCANKSSLKEIFVLPFFSSYFPRLSNLNLTDNNLNSLSPLDLSRYNFNLSVKANT